MLQLPDIAPQQADLNALAGYQVEVDSGATYEAQVALGKDLFGQHSRNATFGRLREVLTAMCYGPRRCAYCEDSVPDEVEHIKPKDLYPDEVFAWANYLYSCGRCNGPKNNRFAVIPAGQVDYVEVTRPRNAPVVMPQAGDPALINPRAEDPLQYMALDIIDTFEFVPLGDDTQIGYRRAEFTIDVLHLNDRDELVAARRLQYEAYSAMLERYANRREGGAPVVVLEEYRDEVILRQPHPTVLREMQRRSTFGELAQLFGRLPAEAVDWRPIPVN